MSSLFEKRNFRKKRRLKSYKNDERLKEFAEKFGREIERVNWGQNFEWFGVPIVQSPIDLQAKQEIIWKVKPDLIIETGIKYGGSLVWSACMLTLLEECDLIENGEVIGIDIKNTPNHKDSVHNNPMIKKITMFKGSSISKEIIEKVKEFTYNKKSILVFLDSRHSHDHVLEELRLYSEFVTKGSYIVVDDTFVEKLDYPNIGNPSKQWGKGNNPMTATIEFLKENDEFEVDKEIENKIVFTFNPNGYLKRIKMKPLVSICIPNYNNAKYLDMCIRSALDQTYDNIEVILVDDCSTDDSLIIANKYKDMINIFSNISNIGQPKNTNKCIELSKGKYLVILHSDDLLLPNMVEKLVPILEKHPNVGLAVGERILTDENNNNTKIAPFYDTNCIVPGIKQARIFMMTSYLPCQVLVRREVIDKIGGVDERHISNLDGLLWFKCCLVSDMAYIKNEVSVYRIHPEQTTAKYNRTINHMMEYYITLSEMFKLAKGIDYLEEFFDTAIKRVAELTLRYRQDVLKEGNYDLAKRYLVLATVFNPNIEDIKNTPKKRNFSYSPPEDSEVLE